MWADQQVQTLLSTNPWSHAGKMNVEDEKRQEVVRLDKIRLDLFSLPLELRRRGG